MPRQRVLPEIEHAGGWREKRARRLVGRDHSVDNSLTRLTPHFEFASPRQLDDMARCYTRCDMARCYTMAFWGL